jgi:hypothetical protein
VQRRPGEQRCPAALGNPLTRVLHDLEATFEEAQPAVALGEGPHQIRRMMAEARHLVDERRDEEVAEGGDREKRDRERHAHGVSTSNPSPFEKLNERLQRHREDDGDDELDQDATDRVDERDEEHSGDRQDDKGREAPWRDEHSGRCIVWSSVPRRVAGRCGP